MPNPTESPSPLDLLQERIQAGRLTLPLLPTVATEVLSSVDSGDCDARSLADLLQRDQAFAAHVLRVANSARYAPAQAIVSLTQAIGRLGLSALRDIVLSIAVKSSLFDVRGREAYLARLWSHSLTTARLAQEIARARRTNVEAAFLCGLLHDIGTPVILQSLVEICHETGQPLTDDVFELANTLLHSTVGARLIEAWNLPDFVRESALFHHVPSEARQHEDLVYTTALADALSDWLIEDEGEGLPPGLLLAEALDLYEDDLERLCVKGAEMLIDSPV